jgi:branched-chain amino acid transport system substrate-binding protein
VIGQVTADGPKAVQAWVVWTNATRGGIDCHPLKYIVLDDHGDPAVNQSEAQQLVEQDHAIAIVHPTGALGGAGSVSYLAQKGIPVIGDGGSGYGDGTSPTFFPQMAVGAPLYTSTIGAAATMSGGRGNGSKLGAVYCIEISICSGIGAAARQLGPTFGFAVAYTAGASLAAPDYTSNCQAARQAGVQTLVIGLDGNSIERFARSCASINYHPTYLGISYTVYLSMAPDPNLDGMGVGELTLPWLATNNPAVAQFRSVIKQYAPGVALGPTALAGWASAKVFELATQQIPDPPTSRGILDGLWSIKNNDLGGLTIPLTYVRNQPTTPPGCWWLVQIKGGQFTMPDGGQRHCP